MKKTKFAVSIIPGDLGYIFEIFIGRFYELNGSFVPDGRGICLDVGANIGTCALSWYFSNKKSKIICFEPHIDTFKRLKRNIEMNGCQTIEALQVAVSDIEGDLEMFTSESNSMASVYPTNKGKRFIAQAHSLDYFVESYGIDRIDICKIDVEGDELKVLKGAGKSLLLINRLVIECHSKDIKQKVKEIIQKEFIIVHETGEEVGSIFAEKRL